MKLWATLILPVFLGALCPQLPAQTLEDIFEQFSEESLPELRDILQELVSSPVDINRIPADSLEQFDFFTTEQLAALRRLHRLKVPNITIQDLAAVLGWPREIVSLVFIAKQPTKQSGMLRTRLQHKSRGWQIDMRLNATRGPWDLGVVNEKDAGETNLNDFLSTFIRYRSVNQTTDVLIGDFTVQAASGLLFSGSYGRPGLGLPAVRRKHHAPRILPYRSLAENAAMRGVAFTTRGRYLHVLAFSAVTYKDAVLDGQGNVVSRPLSGYHRTEREKAARKTLKESDWGMVTQFSFRSAVQLGFALLQEYFDSPIINPNPERSYFAFTGTRNRLVSVFAEIKDPHSGTALWGEWVRSPTGKAYNLHLQQRLAAFLIQGYVWYADPQFHNLHGALPGERLGETANQGGFYLQTDAKTPLGYWSLYLIRMRRPWRTYSLPMPTYREEAGLWWRHRFPNSMALLLRLKHVRRPILVENKHYVQQRSGKVLEQSDQFYWRLQVQLRLTHRLLYRLRLDGTFRSATREDNEYGLAQYHEFTWEPVRERLKIGLRLTNFYTSSYESRLYTFSALFPDLILPNALYGDGQRLLTYLRIHLWKRLRCSAYFVSPVSGQAGRRNQFGVQIRIY